MAKVKNTEINAKRCLCPKCPTWMSSSCPKDKMEKNYCIRGKTACQSKERGCICGTCPVWKENNLSGGYFCLKGEAK